MILILFRLRHKKIQDQPIGLPWTSDVQMFGTEFYPPRKQLIVNDLYIFVTVFLPFSGCKGTEKILKTMKMSELNDDYSVIE